ncbi:MAG: hypothetical protein JXQ72_00355 [Anaerolineae bacterium]|nr:hypothetical protein [Anaerolineae bacterium]
MKRGYLIVWGVIAVLALMITPVSAQGGLEQTLTSADGVLAYQLPAGWIVFDTGGQEIIINNTEDAFNNLVSGNNPREGDILILIMGPDAILEQYAPEDGVDNLQAMAEAFAEAGTADGTLTLAEIELMTAPDGRPMAGAEYTEDSVMGGAMFVFDEGGQYYGMAVLAPKDTYEEYKDIIGDIALSLKLNAGGGDAGAEVALESAAVVWVKSDVFKNIDGGLALAEDRVYISDGAGGVLVYSLDGDLLSTITHPDFFAPNSPVLDADGNLWLADGFRHMVFQMSPEGDLLQSFGGEDIFEALSPGFLALGPDGNLYLEENREDEDWIEVWTTEGEFVREFQIGDENSFIWSLELGPDHLLYAVDLVGGVRVYDLDGVVITDSLAPNLTRFQFITAFAALPDGTFMMSRSALEGGNEEQQIVHFDADGNVLGQFLAADLGLDMLYAPLDFVLLPDGDVIVSDGNINGSHLFRLRLTPGG